MQNLIKNNNILDHTDYVSSHREEHKALTIIPNFINSTSAWVRSVGVTSDSTQSFDSHFKNTTKPTVPDFLPLYCRSLFMCFTYRLAYLASSFILTSTHSQIFWDPPALSPKNVKTLFQVSFTMNEYPWPVYKVKNQDATRKCGLL